MTLRTTLGLTLLTLALVAVPGQAHTAPPCNESGEPGHSDYAQHHIRPMATSGDIGTADHDGDGTAHSPGTHQGYSTCDPSA